MGAHLLFLAYAASSATTFRSATTFNATFFGRHRYTQNLLQDSWCLRTTPNVCKSTTLARRSVVTGLQDASASASSAAATCAASFCWHGAHMIPLLLNKYGLRSLVEIGVCTGMSVASVVNKYGAIGGLDKYYVVDPWGGSKCKPGCACSRQVAQMAKAWPDVLVPLRGYSVPMAAHIPNASLDLVYVDAAHDYRNARNDILAYWPKLKPNGIMAGHDFAHWRNYAEIRVDRTSARGGWAPAGGEHGGGGAKGKRGAASSGGAGPVKAGALPPAYGVIQATQELFTACRVQVRFNTWWVERRSCVGGPQPLLSVEEVA